jgi:aminoglycoside phosphotransferase (APT) family kinase protein
VSAAVPLDEAGEVRPGEALDAEALARWAKEHAPAMRAPYDIRQFPRGFSNLTYLVTGADGAEFVLRRPPAGARGGSAHDVGREYRLLSALHGQAIPVPRPVAACDDAAVVGAPFYVMTRVRGLILRQVPQDRSAFGPAVLTRLSQSFVDTLAAIHAVPLDAPGIAGLGQPEGYVARQVGGWTKRWQAARTDDVPAMDRVAAWLAAHQPVEWGHALVHNDFKYDNLVLDPADPARIVAVLDWEMATLGDPLLDLGTSLGYWLEAGDPPALMALGLGVTALPGSLTRAGVWEAYGARVGRTLPPPTWYHAFGMFKIAVIAQQIYARWVAGHTKDPRFGGLLGAVRLLGSQAEAVVAESQVQRRAPPPSLQRWPHP